MCIRRARFFSLSLSEGSGISTGSPESTLFEEAVIQEEARHRSDLLDGMVRKLLNSKIDLF